MKIGTKAALVSPVAEPKRSSRRTAATSKNGVNPEISVEHELTVYSGKAGYRHYNPMSAGAAWEDSVAEANTQVLRNWLAKFPEATLERSRSAHRYRSVPGIPPS